MQAAQEKELAELVKANALLKQTVEKGDAQETVRLLSEEIRPLDVTDVLALKNSGLGKTVKKLAKQQSEVYAQVCEALLAKWSKLVPSTSPVIQATPPSADMARTTAALVADKEAREAALPVEAAAAAAAQEAAAKRRRVDGGDEADATTTQAAEEAMDGAAPNAEPLTERRNKVIGMLAESLTPAAAKGATDAASTTTTTTTTTTTAAAAAAAANGAAEDDEVEYDPTEMARKIEQALYAAHGSNAEAKEYTGHVRSLRFNLKKNAELRKQVMTGVYGVASLVAAKAEELASAELQQERREHAEYAMRAAQQNLPTSEQATTDQFKCYKCNQRKCTYYQMQTRSADEPMTNFIQCLVCGNRWRC